MPLQPMVTGRRHMVSAGHWLAAEAGHEILRAGGNAVDAAVAAGITLGVVVILAAWGLIVIYVRWANSTYDRALAELRREREEARR